MINFIKIGSCLLTNFLEWFVSSLCLVKKTLLTGDAAADSETSDGVQRVEEELPQTGVGEYLFLSIVLSKKRTLFTSVFFSEMFLPAEKPADLPPWIFPRRPEHWLRFENCLRDLLRIPLFR